MFVFLQFEREPPQPPCTIVARSAMEFMGALDRWLVRYGIDARRYG